MGKVSLKVLEKFLNCLLKKGWEPCVRECLLGSFPFFSSPLKFFFFREFFSCVLPSERLEQAMSI